MIFDRKKNTKKRKKIDFTSKWSLFFLLMNKNLQVNIVTNAKSKEKKSKTNWVKHSNVFFLSSLYHKKSLNRPKKILKVLWLCKKQEGNFWPQEVSVNNDGFICVCCVFEMSLICVWHVFDMCLTCVWFVFDMCLICVWHVFDMCLTCVWYVFGLLVRVTLHNRDRICKIEM